MCPQDKQETCERTLLGAFQAYKLAEKQLPQIPGVFMRQNRTKINAAKLYQAPVEISETSARLDLDKIYFQSIFTAKQHAAQSK